MKKIIFILIAFSILFIANQAFAVVICLGTDGCLLCDGIKYRSTNDIGYKQCLSQQQQNQQDIINKENAEKAKIYKERISELSQYSDFFEKMGVNLTIDTSNEQYIRWLGQLKEAQSDYFKEQENQQKIKELEERISNLESKPAIVEKIITSTEGINTHNKEAVTKPTSNSSKIAKPVIKQESKKEIIEEKPSPIIETTTTTETPIIPTRKSFFQRVSKWFRSLF